MSDVTITVNGNPIEIDKNQSASIDQTRDGVMILTLQNVTGTSDAEASYTSGGAPPVTKVIPQGSTVPLLVSENWHANNLKVTNLSEAADAKVAVGLYSYGAPTTPLPFDQEVTIDQYQSAGGPTKAQFMNLRLNSVGSQYTVLFVIGGGKAEGYCINAPDKNVVPDGYKEVTSNSYCKVTQNWMGNPLIVFNGSPAPDCKATIFLKAL